jgi:hypothetical protein
MGRFGEGNALITHDLMDFMQTVHQYIGCATLTIVGEDSSVRLLAILFFGLIVHAAEYVLLYQCFGFGFAQICIRKNITTIDALPRVFSQIKPFVSACTIRNLTFILVVQGTIT